MYNLARKKVFDAYAVATSVINQEIIGLQALKSVFDNRFEELVELAYNLKGRLVVCGIGKSGLVAKKISATLSSTGAPSIFVHASEASHGDLGMITEEDAVILLSNSGESLELNYIIDYCHRFSIPLIGITRKADSTLAKASNIPMILPNIDEASSISAPTTSTTMMMAFGDALAVSLHEKKGFSSSDFKIFHPGGAIGTKLIKVSELMHEGEAMPIIDHNAYGIDAVLEIARKRLGCVGVVDRNGYLAGIFTDGDLSRHINCDLKNSRIIDLMTKNPVVTNKDLLASEALGIMNKKRITHLFVLENKKPIGIIHMHDILKAKVA
jgi:arabinose-5-phosphate isomerase